MAKRGFSTFLSPWNSDPQPVNNLDGNMADDLLSDTGADFQAGGDDDLQPSDDTRVSAHQDGDLSLIHI